MSIRGGIAGNTADEFGTGGANAAACCGGVVGSRGGGPIGGGGNAGGCAIGVGAGAASGRFVARGAHGGGVGIPTGAGIPSGGGSVAGGGTSTIGDDTMLTGSSSSIGIGFAGSINVGSIWTSASPMPVGFSSHSTASIACALATAMLRLPAAGTLSSGGFSTFAGLLQPPGDA